MATGWFIKTYNGADGPFSTDEMVNFVKAGRIQPDTFVRKDSGGRWRHAREVRGLLESGSNTVGTADRGGTPFSSSKPGAGGRSKPLAVTPGEEILQSQFIWPVVASIIAAGMFFSTLLLVVGLRHSREKSKPDPKSVVAVNPEISRPSGPRRLEIPPDREPNPDEAAASAKPRQKPGRSDEIPVASRPADEKSSPEARQPPPEPRVAPSDAKMPRSRPLDEVIADVEASIALIQGSGSSGTGFVVSPGLVVTNKHVVNDEFVGDLTVVFPSAADRFQTAQSATLYYKDPALDLAYLRVQATPAPLIVNHDYAFRRGQEVAVLGNPGMANGELLVNAICKGVMSTEARIQGRNYFQLGISINPGNSGGPVLDANGLVLGVVTLKDPKKEGMGFCIPAKDLSQSLQELRAVTPQDLRSLNDTHDLQVLLDRLIIRGYRGIFRMEELVEAMEIAMEDGDNASEGIAAVHREKGSRITTAERTEQMQVHVTRIARSRQYPEATRQRLADLWATVQAVVDYAEKPRGTFDSYKQKIGELSDDLKRQIQPLRVLVGSSFDD